MIKLKVETHDNKDYVIDIENYDPIILNDQLNNNELNTVALGDLVISRINVKLVKPIPQTE